MSKKGVSKISGNASPKIGEATTYTITEWYPSTPQNQRNPANVTWELFKKRENGRFTTTNIKKMGAGTFTFGEVAHRHCYRIEAYLYESEGDGASTIEVNPQPTAIPRINKVALKYVDDTPGTTFSYTEKLIASAETTNLGGEKLKFSLWEDDADNEGHNSRNLLIESKEATVNREGTATAEFMLTRALMQKAMQGETDPRQLEFYVTVEYFSHRKHATDNIHINNPQGTPRRPQPRPATNNQPSQPTPNGNTPPRAQNSPAAEKPQSQKEEMGIMDNVRNWWNNLELWDWAEARGIIEPQKPATTTANGGRTVTVVNQPPAGQQNCGERYCIKIGDKNELIREINIRLAGFGGNIPTDEFTERTEKMIRQFQKDYMKVPETGKVCGNVLLAIDDFTTKWTENISNYLCLCKNERAITNKCSGFGKGRYNGEYSNRNHIERYHKYERPGIHRSLLWGVSALKFYLSTQTVYKYYGITAGYRCWEHNTLKGRTSTNHMGKAVDLQFSKNGRAITGKSQSNVALLVELRDNFFTKYLNSKYQWVDGQNNYSLEPFGLGSGQTWSWIHMDVREFQNTYLDDKYFVKTQDNVRGKSIVELAIESGFQNTCNCLKGFSAPVKPAETKAEAGNCEDKFAKVAPIILRHEGGFVDHKADKGGATNKGITFATWQRYAKEDLNIEPTLDNLKAITDEQATKIYRKRYWEPKGFCRVEDERVSLMIYDWTITSGGAAKQVQRLLKNEFAQDIDDDGNIGSLTIDAINNVEDQDKLLQRIAEIRKQYYTDLTFTDGKKNSQQVFLQGWLNRVDDCLEFKP
ncbi:glycosyl hydrolase 108 family protein [Chryseobacterium caseinilyticum]|nr:glycosyl hydrolase 108 family protein [Chryseobacterium caseinilyticum]